jgi:hypothetical protein
MNHNDDNEDDEDEIEQQRRMLIAQAAGIFVNTAIAGALTIIEPLYNKTPYHTSALTGADWVRELLAGHDRRIRSELGVHKEIFQELLESLARGGIGPSKHVALEEKLAIFLYICVTGITFVHAGERFQRATDTISK